MHREWPYIGIANAFSSSTISMDVLNRFFHSIRAIFVNLVTKFSSTVRQKITAKLTGAGLVFVDGFNWGKIAELH